MRRSLVAIIAFALLLVSAPQPTSRAQTFRHVVRGKRGVVAGGQPLSVEAGLRILQQGGNAVDAGVATILAASVIEFSHFSFGGEVPILIKLKGDSRVVVVEGMGQAPLKATREFFVNRKTTGDLATAPDSARAQAGSADMPTMAGARSGLIPSTGPLAATVPAVLDACVTALDQFGTKSLAEVIQPAIELADGFPIDELRVQYIQTRAPVFSQWPDARRVFLPNGQTPKVGDIFVQADLARTLRAIVAAEQTGLAKNRHAGLLAARDYFYNGPIAKRIGDYMQHNGGLIAAEDFERFHARVGAPVKAEYHGYQVYKAGFWTQGPALVETLNLLDGYDLKTMGHNSADYIHTLTESLKLALADRDRYYGDPDFAKIPTAELLSKDYARLRRSLIEKEHASLAQQPGDPQNMKAVLAGIPEHNGHASRASAGTRQRYDLRERSRPGRKSFQRHPERRVVAGCSCRRHRRVDGPAFAVGLNRSQESKRSRARQAPAHHADADAGVERRRAVHGVKHTRRRQSGSGVAAGFAEHHRIRHEPAGGRRSRTLRHATLRQLV